MTEIQIRSGGDKNASQLAKARDKFNGGGRLWDIKGLADHVTRLASPFKGLPKRRREMR